MNRDVDYRDEMVSVRLLADHPQLLLAIGEMRWKEWGHAPEPERLEWWIDVTTKESGRDHLPVTWVAIIDEGGHAVGAVGLGEFDIDERRDRTPWVLGMIVDRSLRGMGIGSKLMSSLHAWARDRGYPEAWVATGGRAVNFYQKCGWNLAETIKRSSGEVVSVLRRSL